MPDWTDPAWRAGADAWIAARLASLGLTPNGELDQVHVRAWSTVIRVPTDTGDLFFKANAPASTFEAALVTRIASGRPDCIPLPLAVDLERGWMLMVDSGRKLRDVIVEDRALTRWLDVLPLYAGVQIELIGQADELIALGVPDLRLARLPALYEALLDELVELPADDRRRLVDSVPLVAEMCDELAAYDLPETIQHDDFHDGQVFVGHDRYSLLDWGDACVSHPFFTMAVTLDGVIAWGVDDVEGSEDTAPFRDAYLEPFASIAGDADLVAACTIARRLGWVCRAVNGHLGGNEPETASHTRLHMFLDGRT